MNFLAGGLIALVIFSQFPSFSSNTLTALADGFPYKGENGLMVGDKIISINGEKVYYADDFLLFMPLANDQPVDLVIMRDGKEITLNKFPLVRREYTENGVKTFRYGVSFGSVKATFGEKLKYAGYKTMNYVRITRVSLSMLFSGSAGLKDLTGPVGIVSVINQVGQDQTASAADKLITIGNFCAYIAVTLAVMNLLPIPALDGGRIFFMIVTFFIEIIIRRRLDPKYEGYIHTAGFMLLLGLMVFVMINDVVKLFNG
jgi:regulator of sigma E protease